MSGRLEGYLVDEFIIYSHRKTEGKLLGFTNLGNNGEQRFDIVFIEEGTSHPIAVGFVEAKYLRNAHRINDKDDAKDEITGTLDSFHKQLNGKPNYKHGGYEVKLEPPNNVTYGLVFASYAKAVSNESYKEKFYDEIKQKAEKKGLRCHDSTAPVFNTVYEDVKVNSIGRTYSITLRIGLWRRVPTDEIHRDASEMHS